MFLGTVGLGKMTARKLILDWASGKVFVEFDRVFYIYCWESNLLTSRTSLANLIAKMLGQLERPGEAPVGDWWL